MDRSYDAVVSDFCGTLVWLAVDWQETAEEIKSILRGRGEHPEKTLFVGGSNSDEVTARKTEAAFRRV
ncbi:hypothetical protein [Haladaptatus cibarius]|uniref:hypothetical protein n=1 Tax=Haladaptatus cibarius TaxID=453847 RepID=UPI0006797C73|nr:hypothetical protein [Haladaptatus cibarius]